MKTIKDTIIIPSFAVWLYFYSPFFCLYFSISFSWSLIISFYLSMSTLHIDKVYIDGPCELLIRRSIYKLLAEHFLLSGNSRAQPYCKQLSLEIPEPNHTVNALRLLALIMKVSRVTHSFKTRKQITGLCFRATWSIYVSPSPYVCKSFLHSVTITVYNYAIFSPLK